MGLVNKECIVSGGHLIKKILIKKDINITPLDSEHFSLLNFFNNSKKIEYDKITITASGGPFLNDSFNSIKNASINKVINHPKWKMGFKNSVDSATLANKCLEIIEAHYLFNIPFTKLDMIIHPQALVHSVIEHKNLTYTLNYFYHDMSIPLFNLFNTKPRKSNNNLIYKQKYKLPKNLNLEFFPVKFKNFPVFQLFNNLDKNNPRNFIKFNIANEYAVNQFKNKEISYGKIPIIIEKSLSMDLNSSINSIENVINFHEQYNILFSKK